QPAGAPAAGEPAPPPPPAKAGFPGRIVALIPRHHPIPPQEPGGKPGAPHRAQKTPLDLHKSPLDKGSAGGHRAGASAEIEPGLARDVKGLAVDQPTFIKTVLSKYKKNLYEWKEDVLRPRLQMMKLVRNKVGVTAEELRKVFEATYGEKVECRIILWPPG